MAQKLLDLPSNTSFLFWSAQNLRTVRQVLFFVTPTFRFVISTNCRFSSQRYKVYCLVRKMTNFYMILIQTLILVKINTNKKVSLWKKLLNTLNKTNKNKAVQKKTSLTSKAAPTRCSIKQQFLSKSIQVDRPQNP